MDCILPGSSVHGILEARMLEWVPFPAPGDLPNLGLNTRLLHLLRRQAASLPLAPPRDKDYFPEVKGKGQVSLLLFSCSVGPTLGSPMDCGTPGFPVLHYLLEFAHTHVH